MDRKTQIRNILARILEESCEINIDLVKDDDDLMLLGLDSMGSVRLMIELEDVFGIEIPDEKIDISNFNTITKINKFVTSVTDMETRDVTSPIDFSRKIAVITGANRGIGKGIANILHNNGYEIVSLNRKPTSAPWCDDVICDLSSIQSIKEAISHISKTYPHIDLLINNAGVRHFDRIDRISIENWEESFRVNLTAPFLLQKGLIKQLVKANGHVFYIGSSASTNYFESGSAYSSSKLALHSLSESSIMDLRYEGIRFTYISVGSTSLEDYEEDWKLQPEDIGNLIVSVSSLPKRVMLPYIDMRPSKPLRSKEIGLERLQYI